jgi:multisubunit Na+/H+ antiporter MnhG subunit
MLDVLPVTHPRRGNYVRRMVLAWGALFTAIAPVALYRLGEFFSRT